MEGRDRIKGEKEKRERELGARGKMFSLFLEGH